MKNFDCVVLRMECCNPYLNAPCNIMMVGIKSGQIDEVKQILVNPGDKEFHFMSSGIKLSDLQDRPVFSEIWPEMDAFIRRYPLVVSCGSSYDAEVLARVVTEVDCAPISYVTAHNICRKALKPYSISYFWLCRILDVPYVESFTMSNPNILEQTKSWAEIVIKAMEAVDAASMDEFLENSKIIKGTISSSEFIRSYLKYTYKPKKKKEPVDVDPSNFDETNLFFGQNVVFTGKLTHFLREDAERYVLQIGGYIQNNLTKTTNFLVVGEQNLSVVGPDGMSSKQRKAKEYNEQGLDIEFLTEDDFIEAMHLEGVVANDQVN